MPCAGTGIGTGTWMSLPGTRMTSGPPSARADPRRRSATTWPSGAAEEDRARGEERERCSRAEHGEDDQGTSHVGAETMPRRLRFRRASATSRRRTRRPGSGTSGRPGRPRTARTRTRDVGFISGFLSVGSRRPSQRGPQRGERSCSRQSRSATVRTSRPPLPSGRCSCRLIALPSRRRRGRSRGGSLVIAARVRSRAPLGTVLPQEHLLGERHLGAEQRPDRLAAVDALDRLADERRHREHLDLAGSACAAGRGTESVTTTSRRLESADPVDRRIGQDAVGGAGVDLGRHPRARARGRSR